MDGAQNPPDCIMVSGKTRIFLLVTLNHFQWQVREPVKDIQENNMSQGFQEKVALVTGAASGMGRSAAQVFAREGARVIVSTDSNIEGGEETVRLIKSAGGEAAFVKCDVTRPTDVEAMVDRCVEIYGGLHYAFNNAGIGPDGGRMPVVYVADCPQDVWDRTIAINLTGVFLCMKYEIRQMLKQKYGAIVNNSSLGALKAVPGFSAYDASKSGMIGLTKAAALEYATSGIRINVLCPGPTDGTRLMENLTRYHPEEREHINSLIPMKRLAGPEEMAETVLWLCSDAASFMTGSTVSVDGGMCAT
jgi:NAD(P)-dependent dehydrogenase (short-subunit alcohol dehydrogenase family)